MTHYTWKDGEKVYEDRLEYEPTPDSTIERDRMEQRLARSKKKLNRRSIYSGLFSIFQ